MSEQSCDSLLLETYIFETSQNTERLEQIILNTEKDDGFSESAINEMFRIMHTLKGSSAMMSYSHIAALAHKAEDLFYFIRENPSAAYDCFKISDIILSCIDYINSEINNIKKNIPHDISGYQTAGPLIKKIESILNDIKAHDEGFDKTIENIKKDNAKTENLPVPVIINKLMANVYKAVIQFDAGCEMENIRAYSIIRDLNEYATDISYIPNNVDDDETSYIIKKFGFTVFFESDKPYDELYNRFIQTPLVKDVNLTINDLGKCLNFQDKNANYSEKSGNNGDNAEFKSVRSEKNIVINKKTDNEKSKRANDRPDRLYRPYRSYRPEETYSTENKPAENHQTVQSMISVNVSKLDRLMNIVGEIVVTESMVVENNDLRGLELQSFRKDASQLYKIIVEMQDIVMSMRLAPLTMIFQKIHRIVRDMSKKLNKEIKLELIGDDTEVDKNIIEHLSDPLMHLVRNSIDHGIESRQERLTAGKPKFGTITLEAYNAGSNVFIKVKDDGRGLDKKKILKKAIKNNLLAKPESEMSDKEIYNLIFLPGFSTNDTVTEFSGRGVGMDVVTQNISFIGGSVSVENAEGKGMTTIIKIPLTVAIIDGMNISVGNRYFTIPTSAIRESFKPVLSSIVLDTDGNEMIMVRGQYYEIIRLHKQWGIDSKIKNITDGILMIIEQEDRCRCIFFDNLIGQQQVVVKTIPDYIKKSKLADCFSGCTLLGDGKISLILDAAWLVNTDIN